MAEFLKQIQKEAIEGPLRRKFSLASWATAHSKYGDDEFDSNIHRSGELIYKKACRIRDNLKFTFNKKLRPTTKLRAFAALANHELCVTIEKTKESLEDIARKAHAGDPNAPIMAHELAAAKVKLPSGVDFSPDEIIQSLVDAVEIPIKRILEESPTLKGNAEYNKIDWKEVIFDTDLGSLYSHLQELWDDCLWNGYQSFEEENRIIFRPTEKLWIERYIISRVRKSSLEQQFFAHSLSLKKNLGTTSLLKSIGIIDVESITKRGKNQEIKLKHFSSATDDAIKAATLWLYATQTYYEDLLNEPQNLLYGATIKNLISTWSVVSRASSVLREKVANHAAAHSEDTQNWPHYAPTLDLRALQQAIFNKLQFSFEQSRALVEFLVYRAKPDQELWAQPLLPVGSDTAVPIFATTISPNLGRVIDVWLKQLGVQLDTRGFAFERYICQQINTGIKSSSLLKDSCTCLENGLKFSPPGELEEQIDVVAKIGKTVLIGEAKCFLEPTEPKQIALHRNKVIDAVNQVNRKCDSVNRNKTAFIQKMKQVGVSLPDNFDAIPAVILNSSIHCGVAVDNTPVIDEHILHVFLKGSMDRFALQSPDGDFTPVETIYFYGSADEAGDIFSEFLKSPPQIDPLLAGLSERWIPVNPADDNDWMGQFLYLDCIPKVSTPSM